MFRIGCDVGGTNTDAAILDITHSKDSSRGVLATCKTPTTTNITSGIKLAIEDVLRKSKVKREDIFNVAVGTTHFVNAVVESDARRLSRVACVRLCGPYTRENPPFCDYPWTLRALVEGPVFYLDGGLEIDGREITPLDEHQVRLTAQRISEAGVTAVAIVGVFSALDHQHLHEEKCKRLMLEVNPDLSIVCSHTIGGPGLLVRENATILNATILSFARKTIAGLERAIAELGLQCPLFLTQNDGTLIEASSAADLPVKTFVSGPTNSLMGAAFLQNLGGLGQKSDQQLLVVDVGGTTTDVCALLPSGFPRKAPNYVQIGGVRTAFSMPDVASVALGGGSRVRVTGDGSTTVGPDSVAHLLSTEAMVFGGKTMTASDIMVASGTISIGQTSLATSIPPEVLSAAKEEMKRILLSAIDSMKVSNAPVVVLLVGGGSVIVQNDLDGVTQCFRPPHYDSANAIGAAISKMAGDVDTIEILENQSEKDVLKRVKDEAVAKAIARGADPQDTKIVDITKIPLQYVTNKATRFIVKAVGSLAYQSSSSKQLKRHKFDIETTQDDMAIDKNDDFPASIPGSLATPALGVDLEAYRPDIRDCIWYVSAVDVDLIASGCGVLGTGGGGSSYNVALYILSLMRDQPDKSIKVIPPEGLQDSDLCVFGAGFGAPSVSQERIDSGNHVFTAIDNLNKLLQISDFQGIVTDEIGGGNGLITFPTSMHYDKPTVDCDLMGRAYPTVEHCTTFLYGQPITPCSIADGKGNAALIVTAENYNRVENMLRTTCIELGNHVAVTTRPLTGDAIKRYAVPNTISQAWFLGRAVRMAQRTKIDFIEALQGVMPVKLIFTGKVIDVSRDVSRGYTVGRCIIAPLSSDESGAKSVKAQTTATIKHLIVPFQNEYLAAYLVDSEDDGCKEKQFICTVPDLISILGQDGEAIGSPELRYGLQVRIIAMPAHPHWTTERGLAVGGPEYFHLETPWKSIGQYRKPKSVFDIYG